MLPNYSTIMEWLIDEPALSQRYARAREDQADFLADEIVAIADDGSHDFVGAAEDGQFNSEHVQRSRLRVDARKWAAAKLKPKKYGDRVDVGLTGRIRVIVRDLTGASSIGDDGN